MFVGVSEETMKGFIKGFQFIESHLPVEVTDLLPDIQDGLCKLPVE